jgi:hypothetical protein
MTNTIIINEEDTTEGNRSFFVSDMFFNRETLKVAGYALIVAILAYWVELTTFTLSPDELLVAFRNDWYREWFAQGRWTYGVLSYLLPYQIGSMPFFATAFCVVAFSYSAAIIATAITKQRRWQIFFSAILVSFPFFAYSVQFNINSIAIGVAMLFASCAVRVLISAPLNWKTLLISSLFLILCSGAYQSFSFYFLCVLFLSLMWKTDKVRICILGVAVFVLSLLINQGIVVFWQAILGIKASPYPGSLIRPEAILPEMSDSWRLIYNLVGGNKWYYNGVGISCLLIVWSGLLVGGIRFFQLCKAKERDALYNGLLFVAAFFSATAIIFLTAAKCPMRVFGSIAPLFAFTGAYAARFNLSKKIINSIFAVSVLANIYMIGALFYTDYQTNLRDGVRTSIVVSKISEVTPLSSKKVKVFFAGKTTDKEEGIFQKRGSFGVSFFSSSFPEQQEAYLRYMGMNAQVLIKVPVDLAKDIAKHPSYPDKNCTYLVKDGKQEIVIVKFGELTEVQKKRCGLLKK